MKPEIMTAILALEEWADEDLIGLSMAVESGVVVETTPLFAKARDAELLDLGPDGGRLRDSVVRAAGYVVRERFGNADD